MVVVLGVWVYTCECVYVWVVLIILCYVENITHNYQWSALGIEKLVYALGIDVVRMYGVVLSGGF